MATPKQVIQQNGTAAKATEVRGANLQPLGAGDARATVRPA